MAVRFRKSIKLAPGIRMNLSGAGVGWTLGPRGASVGIGKRGARLNTSFMGVSSSQKLSGPSRTSKLAPKKKELTEVLLTCALHDDGSLTFHDADGNDLPEHVVEAAKKQNKEAILAVIQRKCDEINSAVEALGTIHLDTPDCAQRPAFIPTAFDEPEPTPVKARKPTLLHKFFKKLMRRLEDANAAALADYKGRHSKWQADKAYFTQQVQARKQLIEEGIYTNTTDMEAWLEDNLQDIVWPRETVVSFEIVDDGQRVLLDVDLPEIEDMPSKTATVPTRGLKLSVKDMSATAVQKLYMAHIHAIAFRLLGETFAALPLVKTIVLSGYSQRPDKATGRIVDEYLLSVRAAREDWANIDFKQLAKVDVIEAFTKFELRRQMSKTGVFKAVEPFGL
mgnify:CR=1 FL=1